MKYEELIKTAEQAREHSYCPYSGFAVGAALLSEDGQVFTGCNIENAAYGPSCCAERTAFFKAVSEGAAKFQAVAVIGGKKGKMGQFCAPCGVCRQVMAEFCNTETFDVVLGTESKIQVYKLKELLPMSFGPENLK